jgi:hypothetical protein
VDCEGVQPPDDASIYCNICSGCQQELRQEKCAVPQFALANDNFTGHLTRIVQQLPVLNFVEDQVIALRRDQGCEIDEASMDSYDDVDDRGIPRSLYGAISNVDNPQHLDARAKESAATVERTLANIGNENEMQVRLLHISP